MTGVVVFGGTFDPPHEAHLDLPLRACESLFGGNGMVLYVPAAVSPFKIGNADQTPSHHRVRMLELGIEQMIGEKARVAIWDDEIERAEDAQSSSPSYMVDTLRRLRIQIGDDVSVRLLLGADQAASFHRWREYEDIINIAEPAVMLREPVTSVNALIDAMRSSGAWLDEQLLVWQSRVVPLPIEPASSTDVRETIAMLWQQYPSLTIDILHEHVTTVPTEVLAYIIEHGLYRAAG